MEKVFLFSGKKMKTKEKVDKWQLLGEIITDLMKQ